MLRHAKSLSNHHKRRDQLLNKGDSLMIKTRHQRAVYRKNAAEELDVFPGTVSRVLK